MKFPLKLLLILCALIAGIYATVPLWLPQVLARQLPPGWQLESVDIGYPGLSGLRIEKVYITGALQETGLALTASDIQFRYKGMKTEAKSISIDVYTQAAKDSTETPVGLNDLSFPITRLTGKLPALVVDEVRIALHPGNSKPDTTLQPLILNLRAFDLVPDGDEDFHFSADAGIEGFPDIMGQLSAGVGPKIRTASLHFSDTTATSAWLHVTLEQSDRDEDTTTKVDALFNSEPTNQEWLNQILLRLTGGKLSHLDGSFVAHLNFAGHEKQNMTDFSFATENLTAKLAAGTLLMDASLVAERKGEGIAVSLTNTADIQFQDTTNSINDLITATIPGLQRASHSSMDARARIGANSIFDVQINPVPAMRYTGDINFSLSSEDVSASLDTSETQIDIRDFTKLKASFVKGLVAFSWQETQPVTYTSTDLEVSADEYFLAASGQLLIDQAAIEYRQIDQLEIQFKKLNAKLETGTPNNPGWLDIAANHYSMQGQHEFDLSMSKTEMWPNFHFSGPIEAQQLVVNVAEERQSPNQTIEIDEMSLNTDLSFAENQLLSTGKGLFTASRIIPPATSFSEIDLSWQDFDLLNLTGNLQSKTLGFATEFDGETWTGFDFDISYQFAGDAKVTGAGTARFDAGPNLPFDFKGDYDKQHWEIALQPATIELTQLGDLLRIAHFDLPESVILSDGYIELRGNVLVNDEITAMMEINGRSMAASMLESSANQAGFSFSTNYGNSISANGPISIENVALAGGIDVANIKADLKLENTESRGLENLYAEAFDGQLTVETLRFSGDNIEDTTAKLSHISLQKLLAYADIDGLDGSGFLEVSLPVSSDQIGIFVEDGTFNSIGPGHLAYTQVGVASSNIGLQALENFQYTGLSGTINYQSDGAYSITIRLEGKNPDLYGGHPIVFNLTIGGLLPELFESMFLTGSFEESILNQIETN